MKLPRKLNDRSTHSTDCKLQIFRKMILATASNSNNETESERNKMKLLDGVTDLNQHWYSLNMFVFMLLHIKSTGKTKQKNRKYIFVFYQFVQALREAFPTFATLIFSCQKFFFVYRLFKSSIFIYVFVLFFFLVMHVMVYIWFIDTNSFLWNPIHVMIQCIQSSIFLQWSSFTKNQSHSIGKILNVDYLVGPLVCNDFNSFWNSLIHHLNLDVLYYTISKEKLNSDVFGKWKWKWKLGENERVTWHLRKSMVVDVTLLTRLLFKPASLFSLPVHKRLFKGPSWFPLLPPPLAAFAVLGALPLPLNAIIWLDIVLFLLALLLVSNSDSTWDWMVRYWNQMDANRE